VIYVTGEQFTNDLIAAIRDHTNEQFRERYRRADVLLVDDIQFLAGKTSSEEEFFHTFNAIFASKGQLVVACNQHPRALTKLDDRLRSRLEGGLLADAAAPEETRHAILKASRRPRQAAAG
jgi:chromosomal replication initiator protein